MRLKARLYYALIGLTQATGFAGGLDYVRDTRTESGSTAPVSISR